jgi:hypothetical protein
MHDLIWKEERGSIEANLSEPTVGYCPSVCAPDARLVQFLPDPQNAGRERVALVVVDVLSVQLAGPYTIVGVSKLISGQTSLTTGPVGRSTVDMRGLANLGD